MSMSGAAVDRVAVAEALRRIVASEGSAALANSGRLSALLMDELGSQGRPNRPAVDAISGLIADLGERLLETPAQYAGTLFDGWLRNQHRMVPDLASWAVTAVVGAMGVQSFGEAPPPPQHPTPSPSPSGPTWLTSRRGQLLLGAAALVLVLVAGALGFAAGTSDEQALASPTTVTSTSVRTVTAPAPTRPPVIARPFDIQTATIVGTWTITLTEVGCTFSTGCSATGTVSTVELIITCVPGTCSAQQGQIISQGSYSADTAQWFLGGTLPPEAQGTCSGVPVPSGRSWTLVVTEAEFVSGQFWQATTMAGQQITENPPSQGCTGAAESFAVLAERKG